MRDLEAKHDQLSLKIEQASYSANMTNNPESVHFRQQQMILPGTTMAAGPGMASHSGGDVSYAAPAQRQYNSIDIGNDVDGNFDSNKLLQNASWRTNTNVASQKKKMLKAQSSLVAAPLAPQLKAEKARSSVPTNMQQNMISLR